MGAKLNWIADMMTERGDDHRAAREELWIDGCGGFLLATGSRWYLGGPDGDSGSDHRNHGDSRRAGEEAEPITVRVQADVPRMAGCLNRSERDYLWQLSSSAPHADVRGNRVLISDRHPIPLGGSARLFLMVPSPLCQSAVLRLEPPHRFVDHVDGVVLVADSFLIGHGNDCHIRCAHLAGRVAVARRNRRWFVKPKDAPAIELKPDIRVQTDDVSMTLVRS